MTCRRTRTRLAAGFTLVELLVVSGLFLVFFSMTVAALRPNRNSQVRELSQQLSSSLLATQSRSLLSELGAALVLDPSQNGAGLAGLSADIACGSFFLGQMLPHISGTVGSLPSAPSATSGTGVFIALAGQTEELSSGHQVRLLDYSLQGTGVFTTPWLGFSPLVLADGLTFSGTGIVMFRPELSQTGRNTIWPAATGTTSFLVARRPQLGQSAFIPPRQVAIDLRYSGVGNDVGSSFGRLTGLGTIAICFNRQGGLETIIQCRVGGASLSPPAPLFLLLATEFDIRNNTSLQSQLSRWLAIAPGSGRITVARNNSITPSTVPNSLNDDLFKARQNVRLAILEGAR